MDLQCDLIVICTLQSFSDRAFLPTIISNLVTCLAPMSGFWRCSFLAGTAAEGPPPTAAACLSNIPVCGLWREHAKQRVHLCGCVSAEWKHSWKFQTGASGRATVQRAHVRKDRVEGADAGFVNEQIILFLFMSVQTLYFCIFLTLITLRSEQRFKSITSKCMHTFLLYVYHIMAKADLKKKGELQSVKDRNV